MVTSVTISDQIVVIISTENASGQCRDILPAAAPDERGFLRRFLSQRATNHMPGSDLAKWLNDRPTILYAPDNKDEILPVEFEVKDEEMFTWEQALVEWKKRGCKSKEN